MQDCLFCKIAKGELPCKKVYEDRDTIAFLDINPANPGHTLVMPRRHADAIFDADEESLKSTVMALKKVATGIKEKIPCEGINIIQNNGKAAGQIVNHLHFHIIPRRKGDSVVISYPRMKSIESELNQIAAKLLEKKNPMDQEIMREFGNI